MTDFDRATGLPIDNFASAVQSVEVILSTRIGERVMRRDVGAGIVELLGRMMSAQLFAAYQILLATAIDLWEPRFRVRGVFPSGSADEIRLGHALVRIEVDWMPRGHLGDFATEGVRTFSLGLSGHSVRVFG